MLGSHSAPSGFNALCIFATLWLHMLSWCCSVLHIANKCLEEDVHVFKYSIQDIVDELEASLPPQQSDSAMTRCCPYHPDTLHNCAMHHIPRHMLMLTVVVRLQEMRKTCKLSSHKSHVSRLLFILTRCSRLVLSGGTLCSACLLACFYDHAPSGCNSHHAHPTKNRLAHCHVAVSSVHHAQLLLV